MNEQEIGNWITQFLEQRLELPEGSIRSDISFDAYGVDSFIAVDLMSELSEMAGKKLSPTLLYKCSTVQGLSQHIYNVSDYAKKMSA